MSLYLNDARVVWTDEGILIPDPAGDYDRVVVPMNSGTWTVVGVTSTDASLTDPGDRYNLRLQHFPDADEAIFAVIGLPS